MKKRTSPIRTRPKKKNGLTFFFFFKLVPILIILISMIIATQTCAKDINYDEELIGKPWFLFHGEPFYPPYAIIFVYIASATKHRFGIGDIVYNDMKIIVAGTFIGVISYFVLVYIRSVMNKEDEQLLASGRWGDKNTLKENGLLDTCGVVLGQLSDAVIIPSGNDGGLKLDVKRTRIAKEGFNVASDTNNFVILNTELTADLINEGIAREIVSKVQNLRKAKEFDIADRIKLYYSSDDEVKNAIEQFKEFIMNETLSVEVSELDKLDNVEQFDINGHNCYLDVENTK